MRCAGHDVFGHQGSLPRYVTVMVHHRPSGITGALTTNTGSGNRLSFCASGLHGLAETILGRVLGWSGCRASWFSWGLGPLRGKRPRPRDPTPPRHDLGVLHLRRVFVSLGVRVAFLER